MPSLRLWARRSVFFLPAAILFAMCVPFFLSGVARDNVFPVPNDIAFHVTVPAGVYAQTANILSRAPSFDGLAHIQAAEALAQMQAPAGMVMAQLEEGLEKTPASARGWMLLAEQRELSDPKGASSALSHVLAIAPHDYWLIGRYTRMAARLWNTLPPDVQQLALNEASQLWLYKEINGAHPLRDEILPLMATPGGAGLMRQALADQPYELGAMAGWLAVQRLKSLRLSQ